MPLVNSQFTGIHVQRNNPENGYFVKVCRALEDLSKLDTGRDLITLIGKRSQGIGIPGNNKCAILYGFPPDSMERRMGLGPAVATPAPQFAAADEMLDLEEWFFNRPDTNAPARKLGIHVSGTGDRKTFTRAGDGYNSVALFDPDHNHTADLKIESPPYIMLGHELIHCLHFLSGDVNRLAGLFWQEDGDNDTFIKHEEARTVGLGPYKDARISENKLRAEARKPQRVGYVSKNDCDELSSLSNLAAQFEV